MTVMMTGVGINHLPGRVYWLCVVIIFCKATMVLSLTPCDLDMRANDMPRCLTNIKTRITSKDTFWFGTRYSTECPMGPISVECFNSRLPTLDSMETRLFPDGINQTLIDRYLEVEYTAEAGSYSACGNEFNGDAWNQDVTPTSGDVYKPRQLRSQPRITWDAAGESELYTVIFYDVGNFIIHWVVINIPGNDVASGEVQYRYNGPKVSYDKDNVYAFFLFKQQGQGRVTLDADWQGAPPAWGGGSGGKVFTIPGFAKDYNMTGPVAVNWVLATGDEYAAQFMLDSRILNYCPIFVGKQLDMTPRPFLPSPSRLTVEVQVNIVNVPLQITVCCKTTTFPRGTYTLNPFENKLKNTALVRTENGLQISFRKSGMYPMINDFTGDMYTLMAIDPDVPFPSAGTPDKPILHMMVVNIVNGDVSTGSVVASYMGPNPPDPSTHNYYFLLYKQEAEVNATVMPSYAGSCSPGLTGRCLYDINTAVSEQNLTLIGANWMKMTYDDYVIHRRLNTSDPVAVNTTCFGRPVFADPCPTETSAGAMATVSFIILVATMLIHIMRC